MHPSPLAAALAALVLGGRAAALSCRDVLESESSPPAQRELLTMTPRDVVECLAHLSKEKMPPEAADFIWRTLVQHYGGVASVPEPVLVSLHWVTPAIPLEHYHNLTLDSVDVITNFGLDYGLSAEHLAALAGRVREDFAGKLPQDYTFYDLTALRQILCAFNRSEIEAIRPSVYREAAAAVGKLRGCPEPVMAAFAELAAQPAAFGDPAAWTDATVAAVGAVAAHAPGRRADDDDDARKSE